MTHNNNKKTTPALANLIVRSKLLGVQRFQEMPISIISSVLADYFKKSLPNIGLKTLEPLGNSREQN